PHVSFTTADIDNAPPTTGCLDQVEGVRLCEPFSDSRSNTNALDWNGLPISASCREHSVRIQAPDGKQLLVVDLRWYDYVREAQAVCVPSKKLGKSYLAMLVLPRAT